MGEKTGKMGSFRATPEGTVTWRWPLWGAPPRLPDEPGQFGAVRKHDIHTGVDLYTYPGSCVLAVEDGVVVAIEDFTGAVAGSPWWADTQAILVEGKSGVVCYGELIAPRRLAVGDRIQADGFLGCVKTVLRQDKGRPMTMLHFELYTHGTRETVWWRLGEPRPANLLDPTEQLTEALETTQALTEVRP